MLSGSYLFLLRCSLVLLIVLSISSCIQRTDSGPPAEEQGTREIKDADIKPLPSVSVQGKSLPTGVPIPARGKRIDLDSVDRPKVVRAGEPVIIPNPVNRFPLEVQMKVRVPDSLRVITPGSNGVPAPNVVRAEGLVVPARMSRPVEAAPMHMDKTSRYDLSFLTREQGLSSDHVYDIVQDRDGNIWFATLGGGLNRYDGSTLVHYTENEGLIYNGVRCLVQDREGNFWIGTEKGACKFDGRNFIHYNQEHGLNAGVVQTILEDSRGNIWLGTDAGAIKFDGRDFTYYTTEQGLSDNEVMALFEDRRGNIWIGTYNGGVDKFDGESFTRYSEDEGLSYNRVFTILEDSKGILWFGTRLGVTTYDGQYFTHFKTAREFIYGDYNRVRDILEDRHGNMWFAADGEGVSKFDGEYMTQYTVDDGLGSNQQIHNLMEDSQGLIWIATLAHGATRLSHYTLNLDIRDDESRRNKWINSIAGDEEGHLWFATFGDGAIQYNGKNFKQYTIAQGVSNQRVSRVLPARNGSVWMATWEGGICHFDGEYFTHYTTNQGLSDNYSADILEDSDGQIWIATLSGGLNRFDGSSFTHFTKDNVLLDNNIVIIVEDSDDNIWLGTYAHGAVRYDGKSFTHFTQNEGLSANRVEVILEDSKGNIWFGTWNGGISIYDGKEFHVINKSDGLSNDVINSIVEDKEGRFWVGTEAGMDLLIPVSTDTSQLAYDVINFDKANGFKRLGTEVAFHSTDHQIWWDYTLLDLDNFELSYEAPKVRLSRIELQQEFIDFKGVSDAVYQRTLPFGDVLVRAFDGVPAFYNYPLNLTLPHDINHMTFYFSAIDWSVPRDIKYQYKLEGLDDDWNPMTRENTADYRNLDHGHYVFAVKAAGFTNMWSQPVRYEFTILPPWWLTWWAYVIYGLLFLAFLFFLRKFEIRRLTYRSEALRLKELDSMKTKLYTNITHEFRTPLTVIMGMADNIKEHKQERNLISRNSQKLLQLINQMLDLSRFDEGTLKLDNRQSDVVAYLNYLVESFYSLAREKEIKLTFYSEEPALVMDFDEVKLQHVVYNLLSNALKFTKSMGKIILHMRKIDTQPVSGLQIKVQDTGSGIPEESLPFIFDRFYQADSSHTRSGEGSGIGLALTKEYVELMGGEISVKSTLGQGSEFSVLLPITRDAPMAKPITLSEKPDLAGLTYAMQEVSDNETDEIRQDGLPRLLIIEDNQDVVSYIRSIVDTIYHVMTAANGKLGVEKAVAEVPDIIISDVMMPEMDGYEVTKKLKNDERTSHIPIIMLTAKALEEDRIRGLQLGADAYLAKPFNKSELIIRLDKLTALRKSLQARYANLQLAEDEHSSTMIEDVFLLKARKAVEKHLSDSEFTVAHFCRELGMSQSQLYRKLMALTGKSPSSFIRSIRLHKAAELLKTSELNVSEVAWETGFSDPNYFSRAFQQEFGKTPSEWRN